MRNILRLASRAFILLGLCVACENRHDLTPMEREYSELKDSRITFPEGLQLTFEGKDTLMNRSADADFKLVVYRDSLSCNQCYVETFPEWDKLIHEFDSCFNRRLDFVFVLSPLAKDEDDLRLNLQVIGFKHPIYLDTKSCFQKSNPQIPHAPSLQVFLLDKDNRVVMVGDPLANKGIRQLLQKKIQSKSIWDNLF